MKVRYRMGLSFAAVLLMTITLSAAKTDVADAAMRGDKAAIKALLDKGANVNGAQSDGATAVHWAVYRGDIEMLRMLTAAGADVKVANRNGSTPMWLAATGGDAGIIRVLLDAGASANETLPLGRTPLMLASKTGAVEAMKAPISKPNPLLLCEAGARPWVNPAIPVLPFAVRWTPLSPQRENCPICRH
jgi:uncharacterized protein